MANVPVAVVHTAPSVLTWLTQAVAIIVLALVGAWVHVYLGGVANGPTLSPTGALLTGQLFNWHPILMTLAFAVFMTQAVIMYRTRAYGALSRPTRKSLHFLFHTLALLCALFGLVAVVNSHTQATPPIPNLYSVHSYLGTTTLLLLGFQFVAGFAVYLWPGAGLATRASLAPWHRFWGQAVWVSGIATMAVGLQEKTTFVQAFGKPPSLFLPVLRIPAFAALFLLVLAVLVMAHHSPAITDAPPRGEQLLEGQRSSSSSIAAAADANP